MYVPTSANARNCRESNNIAMVKKMMMVTGKLTMGWCSLCNMFVHTILYTQIYIYSYVNTYTFASSLIYILSACLVCSLFWFVFVFFRILWIYIIHVYSVCVYSSYYVLRCTLWLYIPTFTYSVVSNLSAYLQ